MIYNLILFKRFESFATIKLESEIKLGGNVRFKGLTYRVIDIDGADLTVIVL